MYLYPSQYNSRSRHGGGFRPYAYECQPILGYSICLLQGGKRCEREKLNNGRRLGIHHDEYLYPPMSHIYVPSHTTSLSRFSHVGVASFSVIQIQSVVFTRRSHQLVVYLSDREGSAHPVPLPTPLARAFCQYRLYPRIRTCESQVHSVGVILTGPGECVLCCYVELLQSSRVACRYEVVGRRGRAWLKRREVVTQGFNRWRLDLLRISRQFNVQQRKE